MSSVPPDRRRDSSPSAGPRPRGTLPPPELLDRPAPASAGQLVLESARASAPLSRQQGMRAEAAWLAARIADRYEVGDKEGEREACLSLARRFASRGTDLDRAVNLARRALAIADDPAVRNELAGWLVGLGEPELAAGVLRGLCSPVRPAEMAATLERIAVLLARAGDAASALTALEEAAALQPEEAIANELIGTLAVWSWQVLPETGAGAYLKAAEQREAMKDKEAAFEDRLRAFEIAPDDEIAANQIAEAIAARGRPTAADEVIRTHASAIAEKEPAEARRIHVRRMLEALKERDAPRAIAAALDAELVTEIGTEFDAKVDEALTHAGMYELHALRLELRAEQAQGADRSHLYQELARLYAGPLASPERATEAWIGALGADPTNQAAKTALRDRAAAAHEPGALIEALVRIAIASRAVPDALEGSQPRSRAAQLASADALRELASIAEDKITDPQLASWAYGLLAETGVDAQLAQSSIARLTDRVAQQGGAITATREALEAASSPEERIPMLRKLALLYRGRPDDPRPLLRVLAELVRVLPQERSFVATLERASFRAQDTEFLEDALSARANAPGIPKAESARTYLLLATAARRAGKPRRALEHAMAALALVPNHRAASSMALLLATQLRSWKERARSLTELAGPASPGLRAMLLSVAAELLIEAGSRDEARSVAELACESDPNCMRAVTVLAMVAGTQQDRVAAAAVERAMALVAPRGVLCDQLAQAFEALGEMALSLAWTQRWLALRPGSPRAIGELIRRSIVARDAARLGEALSWVIAQPAPLGNLTEPVTEALDAMHALDAPRAAALARRSLDVFGARVAVLRKRIIDIADKTGDRALAIAALERWVAADPDVDISPLLELARRRAEAGDHDGAARELARAAERGGGDTVRLVEMIDDIERSVRDGAAVLSSDGRVALAEARARGLTSIKDGSRASAALAWREFGALLWDLADDPQGADDAFFAASPLHITGVERYARDLVEFAGQEQALARVFARAAAVADLKVQASLLVEASGLASKCGHTERALSAAARAIEVDPSRTDAIALVERNAHVDGGIDILDSAYDKLAGAALGCYGRRAAHYRGARQFERRGMLDRAFRHAIACFEAVPGEGTTYIQLCRLAERVGDPSEAARVIERVAERGDAAHRPVWLKRAARLAGKTDEALRVRFDLLLRSLNARPDATTVDELGQAAKELIERTGEGDICTLRFARAVRASLARLEGPEGSRSAIAMGRVALTVLGDAPLAAAAIARAVEAAGDVDEFAGLFDYVALLVRDKDAAGRLVESIRETLGKPYAEVGAEALRFAGRVAAALGDSSEAARFLVDAAKRSPDNRFVIDEADSAVTAIGDARFRQALDEAVPPARRLEVRLGVAEELEKQGDDSSAIAALERALSEPGLSQEQRDRTLAQLRRVLRLAGRSTELELVLRTELARGDLPPTKRLALSRELGSQLAERGHAEAALEVLADAAQKLPFDPELLAEVRQLANETGDRRALAELLSRMLALAPDDPARLMVLRELAPLSKELGDLTSARGHYDAITRIDATDRDATEELEYDALERGDHEAVSLLLARRIANTSAIEARKTLRLRRAAVLEQRLGRLDEACAELEALLGELPDDVSGMRYLADLCERQNAMRRAATLWDRLRDMAATSDDQAECGVRAASAYLHGHDLERAKQLVELIAPLASRDAVLDLRVRIARHEGDRRALAEALDLLATSSHESAERRAEMLVEAARASAGLGNDSVALERALRAAKLAPESADAILEARRIEYRLRGTGTPREAQAAVDELQKIAGQLTQPRDIELHCFLLAEELDTITGGGAGMRELSRRHAELGPLPLIALGMAERLVRSKSFDASVPLFEQALEGDIRGLRARGRIALAAAEAAVHAAEFDIAARLLEVAAAEPDTRGLATRRQLELTVHRGDPRAAKEALDELVRRSSGADRARWLGQLAHRARATDTDETIRLLTEAVKLSSPDRTLHAQLTAELAALTRPPAREADVPTTPEGEASSESPDRTETADAPAATSGAASAVGDAIPDRWTADVDEEPGDDARPSPAAAERGRGALTTAAAALSAASGSAAKPIASPTPPVPAPQIAAAPAPAGIEPSSSDVARFDAAAAQIARRFDATEGATPKRTSDKAPAGSPPRTISSNPPKAVATGSPQPPPMPGRVSSDPPKTTSSDPPKASTSSDPSPPPTPPAMREPAPPTLPLGTRADRIAPGEQEAVLFKDLLAGSFEAGERLVAHYGDHARERAHDVLAIRKQQASLRPGERAVLARLHAAALDDRDAVFARAVEHVIRAFDATADQLPPPALAHQPEAPQLLQALLFRGTTLRFHEALLHAWETGIFRKELAHYGMNGTERVQSGSPLGQACNDVTRLLGMRRTSIFYQRASVPLETRVALLQPPGLILAGDPPEDRGELLYVVGSGLAAALPEHVLVNALPEDYMQTLIAAIAAAFGPVAPPPGNANVARLAQDLWQFVGPRLERRMREVCADADAYDYSLVVSNTRQAMRRAGLYASGSIGVAIRRTVEELSLDLDAPLTSENGLASACAKHSMIADLVRLAIRVEYAEARWQGVPPSERPVVPNGRARAF